MELENVRVPRKSRGPAFKFKSRKQAAAHLIERGWSHTSTSIGDWVFTHPAKTYRNVIVKFINGWEIQAWG